MQVTCPICAVPIDESWINQHIDANCTSIAPPLSQSQSQKSAATISTTTSTFNDAFRPASASKRPPSPASQQPAKRSHALAQSSSIIAPNFSNNGAAPTSAAAASAAPKMTQKTKGMPLAERMRPTTMDDVVGQSHLLGPDGLLRQLIVSDKVPSCLFWGPPGTGKTTLARVIAHHTHARFKELSATANNTADCRKVFEDAQNILQLTQQRTIIFLDEIHRFNKSQQDIFLPYVERGIVTLIACTTENPSFRVQSALLSRCKVFVLEALGTDTIVTLLKRATEVEGATARMSDDVLEYLAAMADGDARMALNTLDMTLMGSAQLPAGQKIDIEAVKKASVRTSLVYDKGDGRYDLISAWHKATRGSDANAALYYLGRMLEGGEDPLYVARRMIRCASEDIGLADNAALPLALQTYQACHIIGMPECDCILAQCAVYLAEAPKSIRTYEAYNLVKKVIREEPSHAVPLHIRNAPTRLMKELDYGKGYKYNPAYDSPVQQTYLPPMLKTKQFLDAGFKAKGLQDMDTNG